MKRTKIVCTIGPASGDVKTIEKMIKSGMNAARINFSHGTVEANGKYLTVIRKAAKNTGENIISIMDLPGPKIRIGEFKNKSIVLKDGQEFILTENKIIGDEKKVYVNYSGFAKEVKVGESIFIQDGTKKLEVIKIKGKEVICRVILGGNLLSNKGINLPNTDLKTSALSKKDIECVKFGIKNNFDFAALSFVRKAEDIRQLRNLISKNKGSMSIIAKIEKPQAVENIDEIIQEADAIMIARGDLGIEMPIEEVPVIQKQIIKKCRDAARPVITATQMLESMTEKLIPTRAEVTDVANAIFDGTDAIMLSEETALGRNPVKVVQTMMQIAREAEKAFPYKQNLELYHLKKSTSTADSISYSVCETAFELGTKAIVVFTESGSTARMISRYRPEMPIIGLTSHEKTLRNLILSWNVFPIKTRIYEKLQEMIENAKKAAVHSKIVKKGDQIIISAGIPIKTAGTTNMLIVQNI